MWSFTNTLADLGKFKLNHQFNLRHYSTAYKISELVRQDIEQVLNERHKEDLKNMHPSEITMGNQKMLTQALGEILEKKLPMGLYNQYQRLPDEEKNVFHRVVANALIKAIKDESNQCKDLVQFIMHNISMTLNYTVLMPNANYSSRILKESFLLKSIQDPITDLQTKLITKKADALQFNSTL